MTMAYVSPTIMTEYRQDLLLFAKGASSIECIRSHHFPDKTGRCDLTGAREQEDIFVLTNRAGATIKVGNRGMQIVANVLDITGTAPWYAALKEQRRAHKERLNQEAAKREAERKTGSRAVLLRKRSPNVVIKSSNS